jgi:hypothetical protein
MEFRLLRADEIDVRIAMVQKWGISLLLYKDARCDMNILDETVGMMNWQRKHKVVNGNLFCSVGIYVERDCYGEWVWKQDVGTESNTERQKGEASDSFKRACFNWGIGRELYTAPTMFVKPQDLKSFKDDNGRFTCKDRFRVTKIEYDGRRIAQVDVLNESTGGILVFGEPASETQKTQEVRNQKIGEVKGKAIVKALTDAGQNVDAFLEYYKVEKAEDLTEEQHLAIITGLAKREKDGSKGKNSGDQ